MAFNMLDQTVIPYPRYKPIEKDVLIKWFDDILTRKDTSYEKLRDYHIKILDEEIYDKNLQPVPNTDK